VNRRSCTRRALGLLCVLASLIAGACTPSPPSSEVVQASRAHAFPHRIGFKSRDRLEEHYAKHGRELGATSADDYLARAQALRDAPLSADVLEIERPDGVITRFDRTDGAFVAFEIDGVIRTFFKPNTGETYFRHQAERESQ
jgi:pyocin large subunit-like protein